MSPYNSLLIDAGTGNLHSVHNALTSLGFQVRLTNRPEDLLKPARIILPGVGAFGHFMDGLREAQLIEPLQIAARRGDPLFGICVGMQALFEISEEMGSHPGLGLLKGKVIHFPDFADKKVPHTGWNQLWFQEQCLLFKDLPAGSYAYFNHSYYCQPDQSQVIAAQTDYGLDFSSAVQDENIFGVQFHPEKSQQTGLKVLENFIKS